MFCVCVVISIHFFIGFCKPCDVCNGIEIVDAFSANPLRQQEQEEEAITSCQQPHHHHELGTGDELSIRASLSNSVGGLSTYKGCLHASTIDSMNIISGCNEKMAQFLSSALFPMTLMFERKRNRFCYIL